MLLTHQSQSRAPGVRWWPHSESQRVPAAPPPRRGPSPTTETKQTTSEAGHTGNLVLQHKSFDRARQAHARVQIERASGRAGERASGYRSRIGRAVGEGREEQKRLALAVLVCRGHVIRCMTQLERTQPGAQCIPHRPAYTGSASPQHAAMQAPTFCGVTLTFKCLKAVAPPAMPRMIPLLIMTMCKKTSRAELSMQTRLSDGPPDCGTSFRYTSKVATR